MGGSSEGWDGLTWLALGVALTAVGLALSALAWRRRGPAAGLRGAAWSLLPLAAALTGTLRLVGGIAEDVSRWASRLVLSPAVWAGFAVAGLSVLLFVVSGALRRRSPRPRRGRVGSREEAPAVGGRPRGGAAPPTSSQAQGDDMADVEEILRRRGIT